MNPRVVGRVLWPLHERLRRRPTLRLLRDLHASQRLPREAVAQLQVTRLRETLAHAAQSTAYYRRQFERHQVDSAGIEGLDDLRRVPFLTKALVRAYLEEMVDPAAVRRLSRHATSGSTGEPLTFYIDRRRSAADQAARVRFWAWWGVSPGDRAATVWGSKAELRRRGPLRRLSERLTNALTLPAGEVGDEALAHLAQALARFRPAVIFGYATALGLLGEYMVKCAETGRPDARRPTPDARLRVVVATAEVLLPHHRKAIAEAFRCGVSTEYGSRECGVLAGECPRGGLHVAAENALIEIVDPEGDEPLPAGELGELVVTLLSARGGYGMPMIRYRMGDLGRLSPTACGCGLGLPVLAEVEGRRRDVLRLADGRQVHPSVFSRALAEVAGLSRYRVVQGADATITVQVEAQRSEVRGQRSEKEDKMGGATPLTSDLSSLSSPSASGLDQALAAIRAELGPGVEMHLERVPALRLDGAGKFRWIVSQVEEEQAE